MRPSLRDLNDLQSATRPFTLTHPWDNVDVTPSPAMAALSVGDIIQIANLIKETSSALLDWRGSSAECRALLEELNSTRLALENVQDVNFDNARRMRALRVVTGRCTTAVQDFSGHLDKYRPHLQKRGTGNMPLDMYRRLAFKNFIQGRATRALREQIKTHVASIQLIIHTARL